MADKRPTLPWCELDRSDPSTTTSMHRQGCGQFTHPSLRDPHVVTICTCGQAMRECLAHDRPAYACRDEMAEALRAAAERVKEAARVLLIERQEVGLGSHAAAYGITQMRNRALAAIEEA